jgi:hypothetical protein
MQPFPPQHEGMALANRYKRYLLYFPNFAIPDPLASVVADAQGFALASAEQGLPTHLLLEWEAEINNGFRTALLMLADLAPAIKRMELKLIPDYYLLSSKSLRAAAKEELKAISRSAAGKIYYKGIEEVAQTPYTMEGFARHISPKRRLRSPLDRP